MNKNTYYTLYYKIVFIHFLRTINFENSKLSLDGTTCIRILLSRIQLIWPDPTEVPKEGRGYVIELEIIGRIMSCVYHDYKYYC